ncbi:MAG TPA: metal-dependent hydrolase [Candidatus Nanoarchaeia archaeon]|nr:metal-dependent hydrolase [Candidatus Nanoarchaeia archaeon]
MPLAVTHVILTVILVDLFRDYFLKKRHHKYLTLHTLLIAGIGGLLPDIDIVLRMIGQSMGFVITDLLQHGGITHTPFFALFFLIPGLILWKQKKHKVAVYFYVITFGILFHTFLDYFLGGGNHQGVMWLFPFTTYTWKLHLLNNLALDSVPQALDALILLGWLWHEEIKHKIKDFI